MTPGAKLTVATTFPIWPPRGGGQQRVLGLYGALARAGLQIEVVAMVDRMQRGGRRRLAPGITEIRVPKSPELDALEYRVQQQAGVPVTDVMLAAHHDLMPAFCAALATSSRDAIAVVASHPFTQPALAACAAPALVYEAHNVETDLKAPMLQATPELLEVVRSVEEACCREAAHVLVCTEKDASRLGDLYGLETARVVVVPNGVDPDSFEFAERRERETHRRRLGMGEGALAVFLGSWHEPNVVAARDVLAAAEELPDVRFLVVGSVGAALDERSVPPNVDLCGIVDAGFIRSVLAMADLALNPMRWGSGTNLKMLDYALAGIPILSSEFGARGLDLEPGRHYRTCDPDGLAADIRAFLDEDHSAADERARAAADHVRSTFGWPRIAERWLRSEPFLALREAVPA